MTIHYPSSSTSVCALLIVKQEGVNVWDLRSGTLLRSFKSAVSGQLAPFSHERTLVTPLGKAGLEVWSWHHGRLHMKCPLPERATAITVSSSCLYIAAGTASGSLYLWNAVSGDLLQVWDAHYKQISTLSFTKDDSYVISGGEDAVVSLWDMVKLVRRSSFSSTGRLTAEVGKIVPQVQWTHHSLTVKDIQCGSTGYNGRMVSCSLDRTLRIYHLATKTQIGFLVLPTALHTMVFCPSEAVVFTAGLDGKIYRVPLEGQVTSTMTSQDAKVGGTKLTSGHKDYQVSLSSHDRHVTQLAISFDGKLVISAGADAVVKVWLADTLQLLQTWKNLQSKTQCVSVCSLLDLDHYFGLDLYSRSSTSTSRRATGSGGTNSSSLTRTINGVVSIPPLNKYILTRQEGLPDHLEVCLPSVLSPFIFLTCAIDKEKGYR